MICWLYTPNERAKKIVYRSCPDTILILTGNVFEATGDVIFMIVYMVI